MLLTVLEITGRLFQVEKLKMDVGKRNNEQQRKAKEKTVDTKRMQDLERQVSHTNKQAN